MDGLALDVDQGDTRETLVLGGEPQAEELAEERHRGPHSHKSLIVEGEDGQEEDGVRLKMQGLDSVMGEDGVEELRKRRTNPT